MLAVVQSIASQTFRNSDDVAAAQRAFSGRPGALAAANDLLTQSSWESASLEPLIGDVFRALGIDRQRVKLSGPHLALSAKAAMALSLGLHELATNALKYGALSNEDGAIEIDWRISDASPARLELAWRETHGPPVSPPPTAASGRG